MQVAEEGHWDWNVQTDEIFASAQAKRVMDVPQDAQFRTRSDIIARVRYHPEDWPQISEKWHAALAGQGAEHEFEYRVLRGELGEPRWIRSRWKIFRGADGVAHRVIGVDSDVTERKRAVETLRESEARFRSLTELSSDWYWRQDEHLRFTYTSRPPEETTAYPSEWVIGKTRWELPGITPLSFTWPEHQAALAARQPFRELEYARIGLDGTRYVSISGAPIFDDEGVFRGYQGIGRDITERKHAEEELRLRQEMLDLAQKSARAIAFEWRIGEGKGQNRWSPDLEAMYGLAPGTYDGSFESWKKLVYPDDWPALKEAIQHAQRTGDVDAEYRVVHPDGSVHWLQAKGRMFFDAERNPVRMVGFMHDVTKQRAAEEEFRRLERQLRQAQRLEALGTLAGGIAHDFNNILGAILGYGEMALRDAPKGSRLRRDLDSIMTAGERGRALVDRVLAFSRSAVGERVAVHVEKVVREALDLISAKLPPNVTLHAKLHAGRAAMQGDATQVHQVLMNLVTNAIQAMPAGGTVRVSLDAARPDAARVPTIGTIGAADYLVLQVADTGTGIAPEIIERIFDPFFTTKEVATGTGLGLSLVHGIVAEIGGAIDVASTPGKGSTFTVYLPRSGNAPDSSDDEELEMPRGDGQRVLVVDDEEPLVQLATRTLEQLGYSPTGFTSSVAALAAFRADPQRFDALITDERMPGMSGSALIREVRGIRDRIPIVLMSGFIGGAVASDAREAGAQEVLRKPLSARELATSLARVLHS
jgi:PAS domain S-box-containing protein